MSIVFIFVVSLVALLWAANHVVIGATGLAVRIKISPFVIGSTLIALGTALPEIIISIVSSIEHENDVALGNAIGANIANIGFVLGLVMLIKPLTMNFSIIKRAYPLMLLTMIFAYGLILNGYLGQIDGCLFLLAFLAAFTAFIYIEDKYEEDTVLRAFKAASFKKTGLFGSLFNLVTGFIILFLSTKYLIQSAVEIAQWMGLSELTIGLTIIALGTTLPELITALIAILKKEEDMAIGTVLGSNIYNLLLIMAFPGLIHPATVNPLILSRDMPMMIALSLLLAFLGFYYHNKPARWHGGVLLIIYASYVSSMIINGLQY